MFYGIEQNKSIYVIFLHPKTVEFSKCLKKHIIKMQGCQN